MINVKLEPVSTAARGDHGLNDVPDSGRGSRSAQADIVFTFSYLSWEAAQRRGFFGTEDRLARGLLEHERVGRVLIADLPRSAPLRLVRDCMARGARFPASERARHVRPIRLRRSDPTRIAPLARTVVAYERALARAAARMGLTAPVVITSHPVVAGLADFAWAAQTVFFVTDDWLAYEPCRRWWPAYEESFRWVRARRRPVCAVSEAALCRIGPTGPTAIVPNGVEPSEWLDAAARPTNTGGARRPVALYVGGLDTRLDIDALSTAAHALPEVHFRLVGPMLDPNHLAPLRALANVELAPAMPRAQLIALMRTADVGLIPHRELALTRAMSPLKLYEYLAAGLPVVATDLPPIRGVHPRVAVVPPGAPLADTIVATLARGCLPEPERRAFIERNSWRARHDALLAFALANASAQTG